MRSDAIKLFEKTTRFVYFELCRREIEDYLFIDCGYYSC